MDIWTGDLYEAAPQTTEAWRDARCGFTGRFTAAQVCDGAAETVWPRTLLESVSGDVIGPDPVLHKTRPGSVSHQSSCSQDVWILRRTQDSSPNLLICSSENAEEKPGPSLIKAALQGPLIPGSLFFSLSF